MVRKTITILILFSFLLPQVVFSQEGTPKIKAPEDLEEVKELGQKALEIGEKELPGILEKIWNEQVLPMWQKMWDWFEVNVWARIWPIAEEEIEKRKPLLEQEFEKEKEELKEEIPEISKSLWEKFKEIIK